MMEGPYLGFIYHAFAYISMLMMSWWAFRNNSLRFVSEEGWPNKLKILFFLMFFGISVWAVLPILISSKEIAIQLIFGRNQISSIQLTFFAVLVILAFVVGLSFAKKLDFKSPIYQPQPTFAIISSYFILRVLFLISYEIWFRGYFFHDLIVVLPIPIAIGINIILYALIHIFNSKKEAISSLGFGLFICLIVLSFGGVWPAILIHLSLSLGYEIGFIVLLPKANTKSQTS
jgi:membrane protease YdiL (CAAX protease family)